MARRRQGGTADRQRLSRRRRQLVGLLGGTVVGGVGLGGAGLARAATARVAGFELLQRESVVLHFDLDGADVRRATASARVFSLRDPHRLVIDLPDTARAPTLLPASFDGGAVRAVRYGRQADGSLRIVVDTRSATHPSYRFVARGEGQRLVLDLGVRAAPAPSRPAARGEHPAALRDVVVAIDPGHGGKDPGAIGQRQTREKDVVLSVAKRLYASLSARHGITPVLIREDDTYVELRDRMARARSRRADLFVSIHADAFKRREAKGSSVYALSLDGASSEAAAWLARSENEAAALYGDLALEGYERSLRETLLDLAQTSTLESSLDVGAAVLAELGRVGTVHKPNVEQANFAVLKSPDIPSVLVETAFISNREEERKLNDRGFQEDLAGAIGEGVASYFARRAPSGTLLHAERRAAERQG